MKTKTADLIGPTLDWAVAKAQNITPAMEPLVGGKLGLPYYAPSTAWSQGGPIIEREWLHVEPWPNGAEDHRWSCTQYDLATPVGCTGPTPLIAAMRCYVASKFGDEIDIPKELL